MVNWLNDRPMPQPLGFFSVDVRNFGWNFPTQSPQGLYIPQYNHNPELEIDESDDDSGMDGFGNDWYYSEGTASTQSSEMFDLVS